MVSTQEILQQEYQEYLGYGVASELARINLPVSFYSNIYWTQDLRNLLHLLNERLSGHAQYEIRVYAEAVLEFLRELYPITVSAWEEHVRFSKTFSKSEWECISKTLPLDVEMGLTNVRRQRILRDKLIK